MDELISELVRLRAEPSEIYTGQDRLMEAWYLCSTTYVLNDVLFGIVKQNMTIQDAVERIVPPLAQGHRAPPDSRSVEGVTRIMLDDLKTIMNRDTSLQ